MPLSGTRKWRFWNNFLMFSPITVVKNSLCKFNWSRRCEYRNKCCRNNYILCKTRSLLPAFGCFDLTNLPKLMYLLPLATGTLALLIKDKEISYIWKFCVEVYSPQPTCSTVPVKKRHGQGKTKICSPLKTLANPKVRTCMLWVNCKNDCSMW